MDSVPDVIDNEKHSMPDVMNTLLAKHGGKALDIDLPPEIRYRCKVIPGLDWSGPA